MPTYEVLALVALACVGAYAYYLSRKDIREQPPGQDVDKPPARLMFARDPKDRDGGGTGREGP